MFADMSALMTNAATDPGAAFVRIVPMVLIGTAVLIALHLLLCLLGRRAAVRKARWHWWEMLVYGGTALSVAALGFTAFFAVLRKGVLDDWWLFAHMFGAGAFLVALPALALSWCGANRFGRPARGADEAAPPRFFWFAKIMFWLLLASGLAATATMLLSMLPLLGTDGLQRLLALHRYSGLLAVVAMAFHVYSVALQRAGLR